MEFTRNGITVITENSIDDAEDGMLFLYPNGYPAFMLIKTSTLYIYSWYNLYKDSYSVRCGEEEFLSLGMTNDLDDAVDFILSAR